MAIDGGEDEKKNWLVDSLSTFLEMVRVHNREFIIIIDKYIVFFGQLNPLMHCALFLGPQKINLTIFSN